MAIHDSYSRVIAWLKILLPLLALGILSTVFLVARVIDPAQDLSHANSDIAKLAEQQMIRKPSYFGVTGDGVAIRLDAESALLGQEGLDPSSPRQIRGQEVRAEIDIPDGDRIDIYAGDMSLDLPENLAWFGGGVRIESSGGYVLRSEAMRLALDAARISSDRPITFSAPIGHISAGSFQMEEMGEDTFHYFLVFKGGVRLLYDPERRGVP